MAQDIDPAVRFWIQKTDEEWHDYLKLHGADEANSWRTTDRAFKRVSLGAPFLFLLHYPIHRIVGGGFVLNVFQETVSYAWDCFEGKNGASSQYELMQGIQKYRDRYHKPKVWDPRITCIILHDVFFIPKDQWIAPPSDWEHNTVGGAAYSMVDGPGKRVWEEAKAYASLANASSGHSDEVHDSGEMQYDSHELRWTRMMGRMRPGGFSMCVKNAYQSQCAISGGKILPVLQAAHIKPVSKGGPSSIANGLLLRSDIRTLFERGFMTVTPDHRIEVSEEIKHRFKNGEEYRRFHGDELLALPRSMSERPSREMLEWHNSKVYERF